MKRSPEWLKWVGAAVIAPMILWTVSLAALLVIVSFDLPDAEPSFLMNVTTYKSNDSRPNPVHAPAVVMLDEARTRPVQCAEIPARRLSESVLLLDPLSSPVLEGIVPAAEVLDGAMLLLVNRHAPTGQDAQGAATVRVVDLLTEPVASRQQALPVGLD